MRGVGGRWPEEGLVLRPPPDPPTLLSRAAVIADAYSQASGQRWEARTLCS